MKRLTKILVFSIGILFCGYYLSRALGIIQLFEAQAMSSAPAIKPGDWIFTTNLIDPNALDFICFNQSNSSFPTGMWIQRVVALEGDLLEIKEGELFVNKVNIDDSIITLHNYIVETKSLHRIQKEGIIENLSSVINLGDSCIINISKSQIQPYMNVREFVYKSSKSMLFKSFNQKWSTNNFGPLIVPKKKLFVLGDNRDESIDSRHLGFIDVNEVLGVKI